MSFSKCLQYEIPTADATIVWQELGAGDAFITRAGGLPFTFATGQKATLKVDAERLATHPEVLDKFLDLYAAHPCVQEAEVLSFVPNGMADFGVELGHRMGKRVIHLFRPEGAPRTDIRYVSAQDEALARDVSSVCLVEDISRTGFSAHVVASMLRKANPGMDIHTLSMLQRGPVESAYQAGNGSITYHTFVRRDIPLTLEEFQQQFPTIPVHTVE